MIECTPLPATGSIQLTGIAPNGAVTITREYEGANPEIIRLGEFTNTGGGFTVEDTEAPLGQPVSYRTRVQLSARAIQRNYIRTPRFTRGALSWVPGTSRVLTTSAGYGAVTGNPGGTGAGLPGRTIADVAMDPLSANSQYLVTGEVRLHTPALWSWQDVRNQGTWLNLRTTKATWLAVRQTDAAVLPADIYSNLWGALVTGTTVHLGPFKLIDIPMIRHNEWFTFAAFFTTPNPIASTARFRIYHGTQTREYTNTWDLDRIQVKSVASGDTADARLFYMDGDVPLPSQPQDYLMSGDVWDDESGDASIGWTGTAGNSSSLFQASSVISTETTCQVDPPSDIPITIEGVPCDPILLSDPVNAQLGIWVGLMDLPGNEHPARSGVLTVFDRGDPLIATQVRQWETGQMTVLTRTLAERTALVNVFRSGRTLLLRNPDPAYPENNWYLHCENLSESRIGTDARRPERLWTFSYVRTGKPRGMIEAANVNNWAVIKAAFTWAQLKAQRSWLDTLTETVDV